jgi:hypothetical protein
MELTNRVAGERQDVERGRGNLKQIRVENVDTIDARGLLPLPCARPADAEG